MGDENRGPRAPHKTELLGWTGVLANNSAVHWTFLTALSVGIVFFNLGRNSLHNADEAKYALVAWNLLETGDWLTLHFDGEPYFHKSPLLVWLTGALFQWGGVGEFTARFWSAFFGVGTIFATYALTRTLFRPLVALLAATILLTSTQFIYNHSARTGELDTPAVFFSTCAVLCFARGDRHRKWFYLACVSIGLCAMGKHPVLIVPILLAIGLFLLVTRTWNRHDLKTWVLGCGLTLSIVAPWPLHQWLVHGEEFLRMFFVEQVFERAAGKAEEALDWTYYFRTIWHGMFPWSVLLPLSAGAVFSRSARPYLHVNTLLVIWCVVVLALLSMSGGNNYWYILPIYPACAILVAQLLLEVASRRSRLGGYVALLAGISIVLLVSTATEVNPFFGRSKDAMFETRIREGVLDYSDGFAWAFLLLVGVFVCLAARARKQRGLPAWMRIAIVGSLFVLALGNVVAPLRYSEHTSAIDQVTQEARRRLAEHPVLIALRKREQRNCIVQFYLRQLPADSVQVVSMEELKQGSYLRSPHQTVVVHRDDLESPSVVAFTQGWKFYGRIRRYEGYVIFDVADPITAPADGRGSAIPE